jgi:ubiquinone/menaquinone biosynthesis C-methylase UbiE
MQYNKKLSSRYTQFRNNYSSTDATFFPMVKKLGIKNKVILDFGCGQGIDATKFIALGAKQVVGTDPSQAMIDIAKKNHRHAKITYINNKSATLPLTNGFFDLAFANFVIHYLQDTEKHFKEIVRVLKPGGSLIAIFNCLTSGKKSLNKVVPMQLGINDRATVVHIFAKSTAEIRASATAARLKIQKLTRVANPDAQIQPGFNNKLGFKKQTYILVAQKIK